MKSAGTVLPFPYPATPANRRALRKQFLSALRASTTPVIVDMSACRIFDYADIDLLLECAAQARGRDTQVLLVAGTRVNRLVLDVARISLLVPVLNSVTEALAYSETGAETTPEASRAQQSQEPRSAL